MADTKGSKTGPAPAEDGAREFPTGGGIITVGLDLARGEDVLVITTCLELPGIRRFVESQPNPEQCLEQMQVKIRQGQRELWRELRGAVAAGLVKLHRDGQGGAR